MTSLVLELQRAAMAPEEKVADIVRKASVVATKLQLSDSGMVRKRTQRLR